MILSFLITISLFLAGNSDELGWVVTCEVTDSETDASRLADELNCLTSYEVDYLWIPDWASLLGYRGWLVYIGPFNISEDASQAACHWLWKFPDTYAIHVSRDGERQVFQPTPQTLSDLTGLKPPSPGYYGVELIPHGWQTESFFPKLEDVEEWQQPVQIFTSLPEWRIERWEDLYIGAVELRAWRESEDFSEIYERASEYLQESAEQIGACVIDSPGCYTLVHRLPDPTDRESDLDFWIALKNDTLEYGYRVRSFYGEMIYSWPYIPGEAHTSAIPVEVHTYDEALSFLIERLSEDNIYRAAFPEGVSFNREYMDNMPEDAYRDYYDIAIREVHEPGGRGDPNTAPIIDRFRIYNRGEIIWWQPYMGIYMPYEEKLNR